MKAYKTKLTQTKIKFKVQKKMWSNTNFCSKTNGTEEKKLLKESVHKNFSTKSVFCNSLTGTRRVVCSLAMSSTGLMGMTDFLFTLLLISTLISLSNLLSRRVSVKNCGLILKFFQC